MYSSLSSEVDPNALTHDVEIALYGNRTAAYMMLEKWSEALRDAQVLSFHSLIGVYTHEGEVFFLDRSCRLFSKKIHKMRRRT